MRATTVRRTAAAAAVACLALLVTACGGDESSDAAAAGNKATAEESTTDTPAAEAPATEALTAEALEKLALADGDVEGQIVEEMKPAAIPDADDVSVDRAECEPVIQAVSGLPVGEPAAKVQRMVRTEPVKPSDEELAEMSTEEQFLAGWDIDATSASLFSYQGTGAEEALASVRTAVEQCSDGFAATIQGEDEKITKIAEESVSGGDEASAWTVTRMADGDTAPYKLVIVRQGGTLAVFSSTNLGKALSGKQDEIVMPTAVVKAQLAKLG